jgi:predicted Zn-dependent protease
MKKTSFFAGLLLVAIFFISCATVPLTQRRQVSFIPAQTLLAMSYQQYGEFLKENELSGNQAQAERVENVGRRIQGAVERYLADNKMSARLKNYRWEFNLVENNKVNAWCMPGGKVVVYTGMLPVAKDDNGLAVIIAHEIAHAIAEHGNERLSQNLIASLGEFGLAAALKNKPNKTKQLWMTTYGVGAQYGVLLPYSRLHESEADHLGLIFMAMAGYDPNSAVAFWQRMAAEKKGKTIPEYLSTHPSDQSRIKNIKEKIPEAMNYYRNTNN